MTLATRRFPHFYETMPPRYRQLFRGPTVQQHAAIVERRGHAPAHAEIWRRLPQGGAIVCVAADDRPGLLSCLAMALATQSLDLLAAQIYGRVGPRGAEVVDLLWLRRDESIAPSVAETDIARITELLGGLMTGELRTDGRALLARRTSAETATLVHFDDASASAGTIALILETVERPGLFRAVTDALVLLGVRILGSRRANGGAGRVVHRFIFAESDGMPPDQYRRGILQAEVLRVAELVANRAGDAAMPMHSMQNHHDLPVEGIFIDEANPIFVQ